MVDGVDDVDIVGVPLPPPPVSMVSVALMVEPIDGSILSGVLLPTR